MIISDSKDLMDDEFEGKKNYVIKLKKPCSVCGGMTFKFVIYWEGFCVTRGKYGIPLKSPDFVSCSEESYVICPAENADGHLKLERWPSNQAFIKEAEKFANFFGRQLEFKKCRNDYLEKNRRAYEKARENLLETLGITEKSGLALAKKILIKELQHRIVGSQLEKKIKKMKLKRR
jgi:hypothetical protein